MFNNHFKSLIKINYLYILGYFVTLFVVLTLLIAILTKFGLISKTIVAIYLIGDVLFGWTYLHLYLSDKTRPKPSLSIAALIEFAVCGLSAAITLF